MILETILNKFVIHRMSCPGHGEGGGGWCYIGAELMYENLKIKPSQCILSIYAYAYTWVYKNIHLCAVMYNKNNI